MIATRTPFRISFVGGATDLAAFYRRHPGAVISTTVNKYMYLMVHEFFYNQIQVKYSKTELADRYEEIHHPIVREVLSRFIRNGGLDVNSVADVPSGTGLGSSSAFTVGLLHAMYAYHGMDVTKRRLAEEACHIEIEVLGSPIGKQDQYAAAFGGLNLIEFHPNEAVRVSPISDCYGILEPSMLVFHVGKTRDANEILSDQKKRTTEDRHVFENLKKMADLPGRFVKALMAGSLEDCGVLLDENWRLKQEIAAKITNSEVDYYYERAKRAGALGGKLLGAGHSGFLMLLAKPEDHDKIRCEMSMLREMPVRFDTEGTTVLKLG